MLKRKIEEKFRDLFIRRQGFFEIESSLIMPERVFEASGHVSNFREPMVECIKCKRKFRVDHLIQESTGLTDTETEKFSVQELRKKVEEYEIRCPECGGEFGEPKYFMTMFTTTIGPYSEAIAYGRPEAAQGIFVEFRRLFEYAREKLPFAVVQVGHVLRNEISPRQGPIRLREFTIIDLELFFDPESKSCPSLKKVADETLRLIPAEIKLSGNEEPVEVTVKQALDRGYIKEEWQAFFMVLSKRFLLELGVPEKKQRFIEKLDWERAHYSVQGFDQEILLERWGWVEVSGHNYRADYDLKSHMKSTGADMRVFKSQKELGVREERVIRPIQSKIGPIFRKDATKLVNLLSTLDPKEIESSFKKQGFYTIESFKILPEYVEIIHKKVDDGKRRFVPHVIEPSFGSDRLVYITLESAYGTRNNRTVLKLPRDIAPIQVGIFPLVNKSNLIKRAEQICQILVKEGILVEFDCSGSIGRRYARADEVGIPLGITIDYQTIKDNTVTIRERDTWRQVRNKSDVLPQLIKEYFRNKKRFEELGQEVEA